MVPVPRIRLCFLRSLLIVVGLGLHMVHAGPSSSEVEAVEANQVSPEEPDRATCAGLPAVQHCGSAASCAVLPVKFSILCRAPVRGNWAPAPAARAHSEIRSEERRVGKECVSPCRYWWAPYHAKKK